MKKLQKLSLKELEMEIPKVSILQQKETTGGDITSFEWECLHRYVSCSGDWTLPKSRFDDIAAYALTVGSYTSSNVVIGSKTYQKRVVSLYGNDEYDLSLGTVTIFLDGSKVVGLKDTYDFNALPPGQRTLFGSVATAVGSIIPGCEYKIKYGITN